jgi:acyl phosphate:glycerol-3-phosphate acyltransferase
VLLAVLIVVAYLVGSIPFGLLVGLLRGVDPRRHGSGNIGATNIGRLLGVRYFVIVFYLDLLKGFIPTFAAGWILQRGGTPMTASMYALWLAVGFAAIAGHLFSLFLGFKGGKGVATSLGVVLGVWPYYTIAGLIAFAVWVTVFAGTRIVSIASIIAALVVPLAYVILGIALKWPITGAQAPLLVFAVLMSLLIIWKHRTNITRLRAGTETRFGKPREARPAVPPPQAATPPPPPPFPSAGG